MGAFLTFFSPRVWAPSAHAASYCCWPCWDGVHFELAVVPPPPPEPPPALSLPPQADRVSSAPATTTVAARTWRPRIDMVMILLVGFGCFLRTRRGAAARRRAGWRPLPRPAGPPRR